MNPIEPNDVEMNPIELNDVEMNLIEPNRNYIDELPELPFEKVLSYLSLEDRLKSKLVSVRWYWMIKNFINHFRVKSLCISTRSSDFIMGKSRLISGTFAQNFIRSIRFEPFVQASESVVANLTNLKHLRLCAVRLDAENREAFISALSSFGRLERLDIIDLTNDGDPLAIDLKLPMLTGIHLRDVRGIEQLTLDAPRCKTMKVGRLHDDLFVDLVHCESVERLSFDDFDSIPFDDLKNLKYLHMEWDLVEINETFLPDLEQLKEIHLTKNVPELFEQKQRYGLSDLKIYLRGLLLEGPNDPAIDSLEKNNELLRCLAENSSRLADEIPLHSSIDYAAIETLESVTPESAINNILKRFTDLSKITVSSPVEDVERFLNFLKNLENITTLNFECAQPQELWDRLPEHSAVQKLTIPGPVSDLKFLFRLKHLIRLNLGIKTGHKEFIVKILKELKFLSKLKLGELFLIRIWPNLPEPIQIEFQKSIGLNIKKFAKDPNSAVLLFDSLLRNPFQ